MRRNKHFQNLDELKKELNDFMENRMENNSEIETYSSAELKTFISICLKYSYLITIKKK